MDQWEPGSVVQNSTQQAIIRWIGLVNDLPLIGLESIDLTLTGYTDGTCPIDSKRYFQCPAGKGYFILESAFLHSYTIVREPVSIDRSVHSDDEFNSAPESPAASSVYSSTCPHPILSSSSRGILSRLASEREQRKVHQSPPFEPEAAVSAGFDEQTRIYRPEEYRSTVCDYQESADALEFLAYSSDNEGDDETNPPRTRPSEHERTGAASTNGFVPFGQEYFLDHWTLAKVRSLLDDEISIENQLCLNVHHDECDVQNVVDEQINAYCSFESLPPPPADVRIELVRLYTHVKMIFPSRALRLYDNDYLLLAILCSNNQCAYIRTATGWAYVDDESEQGQPMIADEVSQMIDGFTSNSRRHSEQCSHILKNAAYLYYKLVPGI